MRRARTALFLAACSAACGPAVGGQAPEAPSVAPPQTEIEPSPMSNSAAEQPAPIGEDDAEAQRCLAAVSGAADAPCTADAPGACAQLCRGGDVGSCKQLGAHFSSSATESDRGCARKILSLACDRDHAPSCSELAGLLLGGSAVDQRLAHKLLKRACEGGQGASCTRLGRLLADEEELEDRSKAAALLERGCSLGDAQGCATAADQFNRGQGVPLDVKRGAELAQKACALGHGRGCLELARANLQGRGVPRDEARAVQLLQAVCQADDATTGGEGCLLLAQLLPHSAAAARSGVKSGQLYARACDKGSVNACTEVVSTLYVAGQYDETIKLSAKLIAKQPGVWIFHYTRGMSLFDTGRFAESVADLATLAALRSDWHYPQLWLYAARMRSGADGKPELEQAARFVPKSSWTEQIFLFFLGKISSRKLLSAATHTNATTQLEQQCEAYYYIGQQLMFRRRKQQAARMFQRSVDTGITSFVEYGSAKAELSRAAKP